MKKLNVKKDDTVVVIAGKDKGKKGKIMVAFPQEERVIVQNANMITRHVKPRRQGEQGGRIEKEGHHPRLQRDAGLPQVQRRHPRRPPHRSGDHQGR